VGVQRRQVKGGDGLYQLQDHDYRDRIAVGAKVGAEEADQHDALPVAGTTARRTVSLLAIAGRLFPSPLPESIVFPGSYRTNLAFAAPYAVDLPAEARRHPRRVGSGRNPVLPQGSRD